MKHYITGLLLIASLTAIGQANKEIQNTLNKIVNHTEEASLYRNQVNWDTLKPTIYKLAQNATSVSELSPALKYMLKSLKDDHGRIFHNNRIIANYGNSEQKEHLKSIQWDIYNRVQMGQVYKFHTTMLNEITGYIRIVGLPMGDNEKMASEIQESICKLIDNGATNWVVDLRYNGGGNMHPMAKGVAMVLEDGIVGGSKGITEEQSSIWKIENTDFYYDDYYIQLNDYCVKKESGKIAVLTSLYTASSGEAIAVLFKGRDNTKFFGQKTMGMITVTDWEVISESTAMTISVSYYKDRNGVVYDEYIDVDLEMPFVEEPLTENDKCLNAALKWLTKK